MTLPQETIDKIKAQATSKSYAKVKGSFESPYGRGFRSGYETGHEAGATEWAGRAQGLVDALEAFILWQGSTLKNWPVMKQAHDALAKYKEVSNG